MVIGVLAALSIGLFLFDVRCNRLPDYLTLPACAVAAVACVVHPPAAWGLIWPLGYLVFGRGIGGGDIKLALPLGVAVAWVAGPLGVIASAGLAGLVTGVVGAVAKKPALPHGPAMLGAAWAVALAAQQL